MLEKRSAVIQSRSLRADVMINAWSWQGRLTARTLVTVLSIAYKLGIQHWSRVSLRNVAEVICLFIRIRSFSERSDFLSSSYFLCVLWQHKLHSEEILQQCWFKDLTNIISTVLDPLIVFNLEWANKKANHSLMVLFVKEFPNNTWHYQVLLPYSLFIKEF